MNENVNVCITPKGDKPILHFSQFDNGRIFTVTVLADDGETAAVLTDLDIEFRLRKTDSHVVTVAPESVTDNVITFKTTEQMCACCGQNIASVVLMDDDSNIISTLDILVDIQRDILSGGLTSESDIRNLTTQIETIIPEILADDYYTKDQVDEIIADIPTFDPSNYYDKSDVDGFLADKANAADVYTKGETDTLLSDKADASDVYTKGETDTLLADKADADAVYTKSDVDGLLDDKLDKIVQHVLSGNFPVATFTTDCVAPMQSITADIVAVQSGTGTPSPDNVRPISGFSALNVTRTGKNLCFDAYGNKSNATAYLYPSGDNLPIVVNNTLRTAYAYVGKNQDVVVSFANAPQRSIAYGLEAYPSLGVICHSLSVTALSSTSFKFNSGNYDYIAFYYCNDLGYIPSDCQIELGNQASDYEAYNGQTAIVNFGQTVYGGVLNVESGVLKVTGVCKTFDGTEGWTTNGTRGVYCPVSAFPGIDTSKPLIFSDYEFTGVGDAPTADGKADFNWGRTAIQIHDERAMTGADYNTLVGNNTIQMFYELATPIEITTTPENLTAIVGQNNVFADTGDIKELSYFEHVDSALIELIKACMI